MSGFSASNQPFTLTRDCSAVQVPYGDAVNLPAGQAGFITQALGGSFTIYVEGSLFRVEGTDADALGQPPPEPLTVPDDANDADVERVVWEQLYSVFDPEIPVNVVDLGLVYDLRLEHLEDGNRKVCIQLTLTAPGCGMGDIMIEDARSKLRLIPTITETQIDPVWCFTLFGPFRAKRQGQGKAQCAAKGGSLGKRCNAALALPLGSRRASRWAPVGGGASA